MPSKEYTCPYCAKLVASQYGWPDSVSRASLYVCPHCLNPTYFTETNTQIPGVAPARDVPHLPSPVKNAYGEARDALAAGAPTASVLVAR
jgi:DNA-directed RNA polymerase subunit RPC12/RpoP